MMAFKKKSFRIEWCKRLKLVTNLLGKFTSYFTGEFKNASSRHAQSCTHTHKPIQTQMHVLELNYVTSWP